MSTSVVIAEDNALLREGIRHLIEAEDGLQLLDVCRDLDSLVAAVDAFSPDVVLTDIRMPPTRTDEGIQVARYCRGHHPRTGVVLLSQYVDPGYVRALLDQGTEGRGYLLKERVAEVDDLLAAVRSVAGGGSVIDPKVVEALVRGRTRGDRELGRLSAREREVLAEMAQGRSNAAIAASLFISQKAVEKHINSIFSKLDVSAGGEAHPRVRAVLLYLSGGER